MKTAILIGTILAGATSAFAQGTSPYLFFEDERAQSRETYRETLQSKPSLLRNQWLGAPATRLDIVM